MNKEEFLHFKDGKTAVKITSSGIILERLLDFGFEFEGMPDNFNLRNTEYFVIYYPDNKNILIVLKAFAGVEFYEKFISADYRYLLSEDGEHSGYGEDDILRMLTSDVSKKAVRAICQKMDGMRTLWRVQVRRYYIYI